MREAMRWTAPIKAPSPPPTIPSLILPPFFSSVRPSMAMLSSLARREARARFDFQCAFSFGVASVAPSVESRRSQGARRPSGTVGPPERKAAQNLEFAAGLALPEQRQRVDVQRALRNPKLELPFQQACDA